MTTMVKGESKKTRVLVTASTFPRWKDDTVPPFVYELSKRLVSDNLDIVVLAPFSKGSKRYEEWDGMKIYRFKYWFNFKNNLADGAMLPNLRKNSFFWFQVPFFLLFQFFMVAKLVKKEKIDKIHAHWIIPQGLIAVLYKKLFSKRDLGVIITTHGADIFGLKKFNFLKKWVLNNSSRLTVVSSAIKEEAERIGSKVKIDVIPMGVDTDLFNPDKKDPSLRKKLGIKGPFLLFVGRLSEKKGVKYLIDAMLTVVEKFPETKLVIIGDGEERKTLEKQTKKLGLTNSIMFLGAKKKDDLPTFFATADIFVGPSITTKSGDSEGFGLVFAEAMASGCITIGTNVHGIKDIIKNGENGYLVKEKCSLDLSKRILRLLQYSNNFYKENTNKSRNIFSWRNIYSKYYKLLE